ncbi:MAG TPA: group III truncated hemoglobin [Solirubrobacteraceae bacterium]|nr:group III truncated hemoglobin [Solirubrobacteraceae bacterium]
MSALPARDDRAPQPADIDSRQDCERLVRAFYARALDDEVIGWLFTDVAHLDLEAHVPRLTAFWETVLLGAASYGGGAFRPHAALHARAPLRAGHFARWLHLWNLTVDELFAGPRAELAKRHAARVARAFAARLQALAQPPGASLPRTAGAAPPAGAGATSPGGAGAAPPAGAAAALAITYHGRG